MSPAVTTTYTLTATNTASFATATAKVTLTASGGPLTITTTSCPGGTQLAEYAGCTIVASGGTPPYTYSLSTDVTDYPPLPEGMSLDATKGVISSSLIGGQGTYIPEFVVTDSTGAQATQGISFAINGSNAFLATIFPSNSIFHHRVDAATTGLPVDASPAAAMYSGYLLESIKPFFGDEYANFPNGIPAIEVPIVFHLRSDSIVCTDRRHCQLGSIGWGRARSGLPGGRWWKQTCPIRNVAGNLRGRTLDRFLERALARRNIE
jgi:hypothetical protein